jgi:hypothetical protein
MDGGSLSIVTTALTAEGCKEAIKKVTVENWTQNDFPSKFCDLVKMCNSPSPSSAVANNWMTPGVMSASQSPQQQFQQQFQQQQQQQPNGSALKPSQDSQYFEPSWAEETPAPTLSPAALQAQAQAAKQREEESKHEYVEADAQVNDVDRMDAVLHPMVPPKPAQNQAQYQNENGVQYFNNINNGNDNENSNINMIPSNNSLNNNQNGNESSVNIIPGKLTGATTVQQVTAHFQAKIKALKAKINHLKKVASL